MIKNLLSFLALAAILAGSGCEQHPASQTVPGDNEQQARKQALQDKEARTPITINPDAPKFFPPKSER
ncbi:MAG: hypothetical protein WC076_01515 [Terrimicrobiaceae bacterium]|nr:hypothetical protein [Terrimicrobiaceae bacterium]